MENFGTLEEFWEFWDNHSLADYEDCLQPVSCSVNLVRSTSMVPVEPDLLKELMSYARSRGVPCETLINLWSREDLLERTGPLGARKRTSTRSSRVVAAG